MFYIEHMQRHGRGEGISCDPCATLIKEPYKFALKDFCPISFIFSAALLQFFNEQHVDIRVCVCVDIRTERVEKPTHTHTHVFPASVANLTSFAAGTRSHFSN